MKQRAKNVVYKAIGSRLSRGKKQEPAPEPKAEAEPVFVCNDIDDYLDPTPFL